MVAFVLLSCGVVESRVFRGLGTAPEDQLLTSGSLPWDHAYKAKMTVNGRPAVLQLYSARYTEPVMEQLRARFEELGATVKLAQSEVGAFGVARWPDREARFFVITPPNEPLKQIFVYYPEPGTRRQQVSFPVPEYPSATVLNTVSDDDSGVFWATARTRNSSTEVHSFYQRELVGQGWGVVLPATVRGGVIEGMATYRKGKRICYVQSKDRVGKENIITLLVKVGTF